MEFFPYVIIKLTIVSNLVTFQYGILVPSVRLKGILNFQRYFMNFCKKRYHKSTHISKAICHFVIFNLETYPVYYRYFQTFADIFTELGTNIQTWSVDVQSIIRNITPSLF